MRKLSEILLLCSGLVTSLGMAAASEVAPTYEMVTDLTGCEAMLKLSTRVPKDCLSVKAKKYGKKELDALGSARGKSFRAMLKALPQDQWVTNRSPPGIIIRVLSFGLGSTELTPQVKALLYEVETVLEMVPSTVLRVEGHSCNIGSAADNLALSERRIASVMRVLGSHASQLRPTAFGESRLLPGRPGNDPSNRRIEIIPITRQEAVL